MKIATTLFLLVVLVLGAFYVVGNLVEVNRNLRDKVSALEQQIDELNQMIADLTNQLNQVNDQNTSLQKELEDKLNLVNELKNTLSAIQDELKGTRSQLKDAETRLAQTLIQLQQVSDELEQVKVELVLANSIQSQTQAALNQVIGERNDLANQLKQSQQIASLASLIPGGLGLPLVIGYGGLLAGVSLMGYKVYLTPHHTRLNRPACPTVKLTMSERTYHEFQQYLKKEGK
jgi:uncharacterized phage infection (PIP) family protein YhgE